jgi:hypothetical protein
MSRPVIAWKPAAPTPELASARLRCYKPAALLRAAGWDCRPFDANHMDRYRVVVFQKAYAAHDLDIAAHLTSLGVSTVFDLCDNHFWNPTGRADYAERAERLRRMIDGVDAVTVATPELAKLTGRPAVVIDDALDDVPPLPWRARLAAGLRRLRGGPLRLVWYGNAGSDDPPFGLIDLGRIVPILNRQHARSPVALTVVSNSRPLFDRHLGSARFPVAYHEWDTARFPALFRGHDVCLIPVTVNPFTACKTVNRLALALLLGVPAVADRIPSYAELGPYTLFGDWDRSLASYAADPGLRQRHVCAARAYLRTKYTPGRVVRQWSEVLGPLAGWQPGERARAA